MGSFASAKSWPVIASRPSLCFASSRIVIGIFGPPCLEFWYELFAGALLQAVSILSTEEPLVKTAVLVVVATSVKTGGAIPGLDGKKNIRARGHVVAEFSCGLDRDEAGISLPA